MTCCDNAHLETVITLTLKHGTPNYCENMQNPRLVAEETRGKKAAFQREQPGRNDTVHGEDGFAKAGAGAGERGRREGGRRDEHVQ